MCRVSKKKGYFAQNGYGSGRRTVWSERLSFSHFVVLMSTTNSEKGSLSGLTVLPP